MPVKDPAISLSVKAWRSRNNCEDITCTDCGVESSGVLLRVDVLQLEPVLEALTTLDWVGEVADAATSASDVPESRYVLLADPHNTLLEPLVRRLLLDRAASLEPLWGSARLGGLHLVDLLQKE